jgi:tetratricopeptide (TPR) repeat protein
VLEHRLRHDNSDVLGWFLLASCHYSEQSYRDAERCFTSCAALAPDWYLPVYHRGLCRWRLDDLSGADADFSVATQLDPEQGDILFNRGIVRRRMGRTAEAVADWTRALELGSDDSRILLVRGQALAELGDAAGAARDRAAGLLVTPTEVDGWVQRGMAQLPDNPSAALSDLDAALQLDPKSVRVWRTRAHVLAEYLNDEAGSIAALDRALELQPQDATTLAGRGILQARRGERELAIADARSALHALAARPEPDEGQTCYLIACIWAQTSRVAPEDVHEALGLLARAFRANAAWAETARSDPDLAPLADSPELGALLDAADLLRQTGR